MTSKLAIVIDKIFITVTYVAFNYVTHLGDIRLWPSLKYLDHLPYPIALTMSIGVEFFKLYESLRVG